MKIRKAYSSDQENIESLLNLWKDSNNLNLHKSRLFNPNWETEEKSIGLIAVNDSDEVLAFLGVFYSFRFYQSVMYKVANLTSFFVHPSSRGQKLTYRMIDFLKTQEDLIIHAVTPIEGTYNIYLKNGFQEMPKKRTLYWNVFKKFKKSNEPFESCGFNRPNNLIINEENNKILNDHKDFNCSIFYFWNHNTLDFLILKSNKNSFRQLYDYKVLGYLGVLQLKIFKKNFTSSIIEYDEVFFCSNWEEFNSNRRRLLTEYFRLTNKKVISFQTNRVSAPFEWPFIKTSFLVKPHFAYSNRLNVYELDLLYSEIFVLDLTR